MDAFVQSHAANEGAEAGLSPWEPVLSPLLPQQNTTDTDAVFLCGKGNVE